MQPPKHTFEIIILILAHYVVEEFVSITKYLRTFFNEMSKISEIVKNRTLWKGDNKHTCTYLLYSMLGHMSCTDKFVPPPPGLKSTIVHTYIQ